MKPGPTIFAATAVLAVVAIGYRIAADRPASAASSTAREGAESPAEPLGTLENRAAEKPGDVAAWRALGSAYFALGRYDDAAGAYTRGVTLDARDATLWAALGEARTLAANAVTAEAHIAFTHAIAIDPREPRSRYFLGVEKDVAGDHKGALADWNALLADAPADAPWAASVRTLVAQVSAREKIPLVLPTPPAATDPTAAIPGPSAEQMAAAAQMTPGQQDAMARAMVARLAARLAADPRNEAGWVQLMRARMALNDAGGARQALAQARASFASDTAALARIDAAADTLAVAR